MYRVCRYIRIERIGIGARQPRGTFGKFYRVWYWSEGVVGLRLEDLKPCIEAKVFVYYAAIQFVVYDYRGNTNVVYEGCSVTTIRDYKLICSRLPL